MQHFFKPRTPQKNIDDYQTFIHEDQNSKLSSAASELQGVSIIHINTSASSGGVAEMLKSQVPLERSLGLDSHWLVMKGTDDFFEITKSMHNLLQGKNGSLTDMDKALYLYHSHEVAPEIKHYISNFQQPIIVIHDPQPLPIILYMSAIAPCIVRLHPDLSTPDTKTLQFIRPLLERAVCTIVSDDSYRPEWLSPTQTIVSYPAIDPLNAKNILRSPAYTKRILSRIGLDAERPIMTQISRFDPWKDPVGVIKVFRKARKKIPGLQLVLAGLIVAEDDPEAHRLYAEAKKSAAEDADIHLFAEKKPPGGLSNDSFINALQSGSTVILQKSTREGFGMTVTESMWKGAVVIAGDATGLRLQIQNGETGYIVKSITECAERVVRVVKDVHIREKIGAAAHASVEKKFLIPQLLIDHLEAYRRAITPSKKASRLEEGWRGYARAVYELSE